MTDEKPASAAETFSMKPSELDLEQQLADDRWTMGEAEYRELHGD